MKNKVLIGCGIPVLLFVGLVGVIIIKGPETVEKMMRLAETKMEEASEEITQFNEMNSAFLQEQLDTGRKFNPEYFSSAFTSKTSPDEWEKTTSKLTQDLGDFQGCSIINQSYKRMSFSAEFEVNVGTDSDEIILGSNSKGPHSGNKAVIQCVAKYLNGTASETYYWGKGKNDASYKIWRIEIKLNSNQ
ncbi:MAG: hypothetical protein V5783_00670 [Pontiella sp.]